MNKTIVIISVRGGLVTQVCCNDPSVKAVILDHDNFEQGDEPTREDRKYIKLAEKARSWKPHLEYEKDKFTVL